MQPLRLLAALAAAFLVLAADAGAESYHVVGGRLHDAETGTSEPFSGELEISLFEIEGFAPSLLIDDFELWAGGESFRPADLILYQGRGALLVQIANQIHFDGDDVTFSFMRSLGDLIEVDEAAVTYRFIDFRSSGPVAGRLTGHLGDSLLPRRISLVGSVHEVDQLLFLPQGNCPIIPPPPPNGGGGVILTDGGAGGGVFEIAPIEPIAPINGFEVSVDGEGSGRTLSFDIQPDEQASFQQPAAGAALARVTGGDASSIGGTLESGGTVALLAPSGIVFTPTLEDLGITAPSGAELSFDAAGALTVATDGDLFVVGGVVDVPGLTSLTLIALGRVVVEGTLELPPDVSLRIEAGEIVIGGGVVTPGDVVLNPLPPLVGVPFCDDLRPVFPPEARQVGSFTLEMSAARQVEIEIGPGRRMGHWRHGIIAVWILGSADFDVRDVDERSLRLGPGEAEPKRSRGRARTHRADVDGDGEMDLVVRFDVEEAGIAPGDAPVCLFGQTRDGAWIEGCDRFEAPAASKGEKKGLKGYGRSQPR